jgi:hypothetical protein
VNVGKSFLAEPELGSHKLRPSREGAPFPSSILLHVDLCPASGEF